MRLESEISFFLVKLQQIFYNKKGKYLNHEIAYLFYNSSTPGLDVEIVR